MELRHLGSTGVQVSAICLGTMTFGNPSDEVASKEVLDHFLDAGGNFIDTADAYTAGVSEDILGHLLVGRRDHLIIATKGWSSMGSDPNERGASRRHLISAVEASLRRLNTDWIDLYQVHWPDFSVPLEQTMSTLDDLVRSGKIRYAGLSNFLGSGLQHAIDLSTYRGLAPVVAHQPQYSLACREIEFETLPLCADHNIAVLPWSPLGGGTLTGKYRSGDPAAETRLGRGRGGPLAPLDDKNTQIVDAVCRIADSLGRSPAQVALNWVLHKPGVTSPIVGARTVEQLDDNLGAVGWKLEPEHVATLDEVSMPELSYPHSMYQLLGVRSYD